MRLWLYILVASSCFASFVAAWDAQQGSTLSPTAAPGKKVGWLVFLDDADAV